MTEKENKLTETTRQEAYIELPSHNKDFIPSGSSSRLTKKSKWVKYPIILFFTILMLIPTFWQPISSLLDAERNRNQAYYTEQNKYLSSANQIEKRIETIVYLLNNIHQNIQTDQTKKTIEQNQIMSSSIINLWDLYQTEISNHKRLWPNQINVQKFNNINRKTQKSIKDFFEAYPQYVISNTQKNQLNQKMKAAIQRITAHNTYLKTWITELENIKQEP